MSYFAMSKLALTWAFRKPATSRYPFEPRIVIPGSRGQVVFTKDTCVYCTVCAKKCPTAALTVNRAQKQWSIDPFRCISCGACVEACPKHSIALSTSYCAPTLSRNAACN